MSTPVQRQPSTLYSTTATLYKFAHKFSLPSFSAFKHSIGTKVPSNGKNVRQLPLGTHTNSNFVSVWYKILFLPMKCWKKPLFITVTDMGIFERGMLKYGRFIISKPQLDDVTMREKLEKEAKEFLSSSVFRRYISLCTKWHIFFILSMAWVKNI